MYSRSFGRIALLLCAVCAHAQATRINISSRPLHQGVKRFGINLSGQNFYDSGQIMRNLIFRNPGFEGETWGSILRCKRFTRTACTDVNPYTTWPTGFMDGAHFTVLSGPASGATGTVFSSKSSADPAGFSIHFNSLATNPNDNDFIVLRADKPGGDAVGWWTNYTCGAKAVTDVRDLPSSGSRQSLHVLAGQPCQTAEITSYFDTFEGHSFVHLHGSYQLRFRAKARSLAPKLNVRVERLDTRHGLHSFLDKPIALTRDWQQYTVPVIANDVPDATGNVGVTFHFAATDALLDDVSFTAVRSAANPTEFRDEVVATLRDLHPGILRFMDNGTNFGSSLDDMLAPVESRRRTGASTQENLREDIAIGLPEVLQLCEAIGAEPWISLPPVFTTTEAQQLLEYLAAPASTPYGAKRAAAGRQQPWTAAFPLIHLELGNEEWNSLSFSGSTMQDPTVYGMRAAQLFRAIQSSPWYRAGSLDLVAGSWAGVPWWTEQEARALQGAADSIAIAPYLFSEYNSAPNPEQVFGPMFAQPEQLSSTPNATLTGQYLARNTLFRDRKLAVYEVNLGTATGSADVTQTAIDRTIPSIGAGLTVANHMLMMLRELGITDQCYFALTEFQNSFSAPSGPARTTPLWGAVVDMGGLTNRRRPAFLALQTINQAMLPTMVSASFDGPNPTWHQPLSPNDKIELDAAHLLQTYAFTDGARHTAIVFNLSRTRALPIVFENENAPYGIVTQTLLTAKNLEDNNELSELVKPVTTIDKNMYANIEHTLPPFSMTIFSWKTQ